MLLEIDGDGGDGVDLDMGRRRADLSRYGQMQPFGYILTTSGLSEFLVVIESTRQFFAYRHERDS
jgi:hypothetical protein